MIDKVDFYIEAVAPPEVLAVDPERGATIFSLPQIAVTFTEAVTGVTADDMTVNGSAATDVTGSGAGPYVFTGYAAPGLGTVNVVLAADDIEDAEGNPFAGDSWTYEMVEPIPSPGTAGPMRWSNRRTSAISTGMATWIRKT